jgi:sugar/nucleoside kinase (ribokinase family)
MSSASNVIIIMPMTSMTDDKPVCVIGNLNIDLIIRNVPYLPAWGQEVMGSSRIQVSSGQAGYLAFALSRLGVPTSLIGNVGKDLYGQQIIADLHAYGVNTSGVALAGQTGITVAIVRADGERAFVSDLACLQDFSETMILQHWGLVKAAAIVCLVGLFCLPNLSLQAATRVLEKARRAGKITMLDTGWDPHNWSADTLAGMRTLLKQVSLFMPNLNEAHAITGQETAVEAAAALQELGPDLVVIKCGPQGSYARHGSQTYQVPARTVRVYDAVGAGDVFNAGFLFGFRHGWSLEDCMVFGNSTASLYISKELDRFPKLDEATSVARDYPAKLASDASKRTDRGKA